MEMQFQKTVVPYLQTVTQQMQTQEQTQQVRLSDAMPDVGRVVASWGQVLLKGKEWRSDSFCVSGGVKAWVLYAPEDGTQVRCVESWLPFQMKWDLPDVQQDGTVVACPMPTVVEARMLSDRKLMVRANVRIMACAMVAGEKAIYVPKELPQDMQMLCNTYPMRLPVEAGEKAFEMEDNIALPPAEQPVETLLRYCMEIVLSESKLVADKLVFRGVAHLHLLYMGTDSRLHSWNTELPFSQYAQLEEAYESCAEAKICFGVTALEMDPAEDGTFQLKTGITAQYVIYDQKQVSVVQDMYSPTRTVDLKFEQLQLPAVLDETNRNVRVDITPETIPLQTVDTVFVPDVPQMHRENGDVHIRLGGILHLLGINEDGGLYNENCHWEDTLSIPAGELSDVCVHLHSDTLHQSTGTGMRTELQLNLMTTMGQPMSVVTGAELEEAKQPDPNRPGLILRRLGQESLWELAKRTGSTVEAIQKLNGLQQEPAADKMLLIPIM